MSSSYSSVLTANASSSVDPTTIAVDVAADIDTESAYTSHRHKMRKADVLEVWFTGCPCDVGGGSVQNDTRHSLARIPLRWMIRECFQAQTRIIFDAQHLQELGLDPATLYPFVLNRPPLLPVGDAKIEPLPPCKSEVQVKRQSIHNNQTFPHPTENYSAPPGRCGIEEIWQPWARLGHMIINTTCLYKVSHFNTFIEGSDSLWVPGLVRVIAPVSKSRMKKKMSEQDETMDFVPAGFHPVAVTVANVQRSCKTGSGRCDSASLHFLVSFPFLSLALFFPPLARRARGKTASSKKGIYYTSLCFTARTEFCCSIKVYTLQLESLQISDDEDVPVAPPPIALPTQAPCNAATAPVQPPHAVLPGQAPCNAATGPANAVASASSSSTINEPRCLSRWIKRTTQRTLKNAQRKELCQHLAWDNPEAAKQQMREAGQLRAPLIAEVLQDVFNELATYELAVAHALSAPYPSDLMFIQAVVNTYISARGHIPIPSSSPAWNSFGPREVSLFAAITRNPTQWDASPFLQDRTIILSKKGDPPPVSVVHNYIHRITVPNATKALKNFLVAYSANVASTTLQLILQGANLERVKDMFVDSLRAYGLEDAAIGFMDHVINHPATKMLHRKHVRLRSAPQKLAYMGITETVACRDRAKHDFHNGVAVAVTNFLTSNEELAIDTYHIPGLDTPTFGPCNLRTNPVASQKQRIIRALLGASAMNSAEGGVLPIFLPTSEEVLLRQRALPTETRDR
ncbi:hypothetical protein DFH09DRAFT_1080637 [Mycena vulgaris]|nr:hypothetical protein DFH09DRAFT_1080637 [Mycena vulgaris]